MIMAHHTNFTNIKKDILKRAGSINDKKYAR